MLEITGIRQGLVIDHIKPGMGLKLFKYLGLEESGYKVALIINAESKKMGRKDIIKIEDVTDIDLALLGFLDSKITINVIKDEKIIEKLAPELPKVVENVISCKNPRCISSEERNLVQRFVRVDKAKGIYKCAYCDHIYSWDN